MTNSSKTNMNKPNIVYVISIVSSLVFVNIQPLTTNLSFLITVLFVSTMFCALIILLNSKFSLKFQRSQLAFWFLIIIFASSLINTLNLSQSLKYILFYFIALITMSLLTTDTKWFFVFWKLQITFALIHAIITLISYLYTDLYVSLFSPLLNDFSRNFTLSYLYNFNFHAGIAGQTGTNAFYLSLGHAIVIPNLLDKKRKSKRIFNIILFLILLWALFLTGKRGLLLANFFAIAILYYISNRDKMISKIKKFTRYVLFLLLFAFVIYISYLYVPAVNHLLFRFFDNSLYTLSGDISSGRFNLYRLAWKTFLSNPIMGVGIDAFIYVPYAGSSRNIGAHNDWLQLLAEIGILGTVLFTITILTVFQKTVRLCNNSRTYRKYRPFLYASLYCQSFILIDSLTGMPFHNYSMLLTYMIFISIPYAVQNKLTSQRVFNSI